MSASGERYKMVDSVEECVIAVENLSKESVVAVDAEGVHLGKEGPLTLLQVAKLDGFVYLFNIFVEPKLFDDGRLKSVLENKDIVKVFHSCSGDSAALKCQFDVMLVNVFDIQTAQYIIEKAQGRQLPNHRKLMDLCSLYTDVSSLDDKDDVQAKWYKTDGAYWAKQKFTPEMIDYACADVRVMVPEVYEKLKSILDEKNLWQEFEERVEFELQFRWNDKIRNDKNEETNLIVKKLLRQFDSKYASNTKLADVRDEDHLHALRQIRIQEVEEFSGIVKKLKNQFLKQEIDEIERDLNSKGDAFVPLGSHFRILASGKSSHDVQVKMTAQRLNDKLDGILKKDLVLKYDETTPAKYLSEDEKRYMRRQPSSTSCCSDPILRHLYNVSIAEDEEKIEALRTKFRKEGRQFSLPTNEHRLFKYFISASNIPFSLKSKAKSFLNELQDAGIISSPRKRSYRF